MLKKIIRKIKKRNNECNLSACAKNYNKTCTKNNSHLLNVDETGKLNCPEFDFE